MKKRALIYAALSAITLCAGERMNVSVCNLGQIPEPIVARARHEVSLVFRSLDVEVVWSECDEGPDATQAARQHWYTIRLRNDAPPRTRGPMSLDAMGIAYVSGDAQGYLADANWKMIQATAGPAPPDAAVLLGCVMAHELGHLLLGPGHIPSGIMRAVWKSNDLSAALQRWLTFNTAQGKMIRCKLRTKIGEAAGCVSIE